MQALAFHTTQFDIVDRSGQPWLRANQIGLALDYADGKAIQRIYARHKDEFTDAMTGVVKLTTPSGEQEARIFSLRGAHLLAMFARTSVAKEFRRWVLDVLEGKVELYSQPRIAPALDLDYPVARWLTSGRHRPHVAGGQSGVFVTADMFFDQPSPTLAVLGELRRAGYNVEACYLEVQGMRHHLEVSRNFMHALRERAQDTLNGGVRFQR